MAYAKKGAASAAKAAGAVSATKKEETVVKETPVVETSRPEKKKELKMDLLVPCVSMVKNGKLVYKSKRQMGYSVIWNGFKDVQYLDLGELVAMKSTDTMFFSENWIVIPDSFEDKAAVIEFLRIKQYYSDDVNLFNIASMIDSNDANTIVARISEMSDGMQSNVLSIIRELIEDGSLDSVSKIRAIEKHFGCNLI